jgi:hypothetical protein
MPSSFALLPLPLLRSSSLSWLVSALSSAWELWPWPCQSRSAHMFPRSDSFAMSELLLLLRVEGQPARGKMHKRIQM